MTTSNQTRRIPELDGVRGIAVLLVLFYHFFWWGSNGSTWGGISGLAWKFAQVGWSGVNLFFVLSGFLITGILLDAKESPRYFRNFYGRRVLRIFPAYFITLGIVYFAFPNAGPFVALSALFLTNFAPFFQIEPTYPVLWSIAIEEHFYLVWPLLVKKLSKRGFLCLCVGIVVLEPVLRAIAFGVQFPEDRQPWCRFDSLAWGALIAIFVRSRHGSRAGIAKLAAVSVLLAGAFYFAGSPFGIFSRKTLAGAAFLNTMIDLFMSGVLLTALAVAGTKWGRPLAKGILPRWGLISYSAYLLHCFISPLWEEFHPAFLVPGETSYAVAQCAFGLSLTFVLASLSYAFIEQPILKFRKYFANDAENISTSSPLPVVPSDQKRVAA